MNLLAKRSCITMQNNRRHEAKKSLTRAARLFYELQTQFECDQLTCKTQWAFNRTSFAKKVHCKELCIVK